MAINKIPGEAIEDNAITSDSIAANSIPIEKISDVDLSIAPETLTIDVAAPAAGQDTQWLWNWEQSTLPYARRTITNSNELNVPLYKQGTYTVNNFAKTQYGLMTQAHTIHLKWIDGAGTQNNISWVTDQGTFTDSHPDINGGADTTVQRLLVSVPSTVTPPTLTAPSVSYTVSFANVGAYTFSGPRAGDNPNIGPLRRGGTYTFNVNASGHPFYLTTDNGTNFSSGTYFGEYTNGVTGSRTDNGTITFVVPNNAPDTLYYQCGIHGAMRGAITIKDLAVETNVNGNYVVYAQHTQEGHKTPVEIRPIPSLVNQMCLVYDASTNTFVPQDLATYVENTPSFENKIREVAGTAELVVEDGSTVIAKVNVYDDSTYLPLTDNNAGDQAFATDTNILYIWDGSAWQQAGTTNTDDLTEGSTNLFYTDARVDSRISSSFVLPTGTTAQRPVSPTVGMLRYNTDTATVEKYTGTGWYSLNTFPTITNVSYASGLDDTDPLGGETVTITGTNFEIGSTLLLDNVSISYSVVNDTEITFTTPAKTAGDYDLILVSPGGSQATSINAISYNGVPTWTTSAGSLGSFDEGDSVSIQLVASEPDSGTITYTIVSGSLPSGLSLSGNTISGTAPAELSDTSYPFTVRATDDENQSTDRNFTITVVASATYAVAPSGATAYTADVTANGSSAYTFSNATDRDGSVSGDNDSINILAGDTITITNNASSSHPIYFKTVQGTGTGNLVTGATGQGASGGSDISWTPSEPGTYYYQCSNHSAMNGTIVVSAAEAAEDSAFTFNVTTTNVPDSTTLYWTIENVTTSNADFSSTSGSFTITSNSGSFTVTPIDDSDTNGELFYIRVRTTSTSGSVVADSAQVQVIEGAISSLTYLARTDSGDNSTATLSLPNNIQSGDLLIITEYGPDVTTDISWGGNYGSQGFTKLADAEHAAVDQRIWYKIATGTESGANWQGQTGSNEIAACWHYRANVPIVSISAKHFRGRNDVDRPSTTVSVADGACLLFSSGGTRTTNAYTVTNNTTGMSTQNSINSGGNGEAMAACWKFYADGDTRPSSVQFDYSNGSSSSRETAIAGCIVLHADNSGTGEWDYVNTNEYTFSGSQTTNTLVSPALMPHTSNVVTGFDLEFEAEVDPSGGTNQWVICTYNQGNGYNGQEGYLVGYYSWSTTGYTGPQLSIAGNNLGAYGFGSGQQWSSSYTKFFVSYRIYSSTNTRNWFYQTSAGSSLSGSSKTANGIISTSSGGADGGIDWNQLMIGAGANQGNPGPNVPFKGKIKNIKIRSA
jgi:plastocyanin